MDVYEGDLVIARVANNAAQQGAATHCTFLYYA
jgi:hypothetical protein